MEIFHTEEQQVEHIKQLWGKYGTTIIVAAVLGLALNFGVQAWKSHKGSFQAQASMSFEKMIDDMASADVEGMEAEATVLISKYKKTPYATFASMMLARQAVNEGEFEKARTHLEWVIKNTNDRPLKQVATIRLARVLLAEKKQDEALAVLDKVIDDNFMPAIEEVKGDIFLSRGDKLKARNAYRQALTAFPNNAQARPVLKMKHDALASFVPEDQALVGAN